MPGEIAVEARRESWQPGATCILLTYLRLILLACVLPHCVFVNEANLQMQEKPAVLSYSKEAQIWVMLQLFSPPGDVGHEHRRKVCRQWFSIALED